MKLAIPLTGTVLVEGSLSDGNLVGDPKDPVRPINIDLGHVSWVAEDIDLKNELMIIEITPADTISEPTGEIDADGKPIYKVRPTTDEEKVSFLQYAQGLVVNHTKDELYQMSECERLKRPFMGEKK